MRTNTFKDRVAVFINENPNLSRKEYIEAFMEMGMKESAASIYHYLYVTKARKVAEELAAAKKAMRAQARKAKAAKESATSNRRAAKTAKTVKGSARGRQRAA